MDMLMNPGFVEIVKILGHIALPAFITVTMLKMRFHPIFCVAMAFCMISSKEILDLQTINFMEYDDLLINLCGSTLGYIFSAA